MEHQSLLWIRQRVKTLAERNAGKEWPEADLAELRSCTDRLERLLRLSKFPTGVHRDLTKALKKLRGLDK
jgi:hypothetical protein